MIQQKNNISKHYNLNVDWNADNWREQLERDMFTALDMYVKTDNYSYDHANV